jgi:hypothetical protein
MKKFTALLSLMPPVRTGYGTTLSMHAVYDAENPEHQKWAAATPSASVTMNVTNDFGDQVEPGKYIVTFEKVEG